MNLEAQVMNQLKEAMKAKNEAALRALRAIKGALVQAKTEKGASEMTPEKELALLTKLAKQRKESIDIFVQQGREDLATIEQEELEVINTFLPAQLSEAEIEAEVSAIIAELGATSIKEMGKVMGVANQKLAGRADGGLISKIVKSKLG